MRSILATFFFLIVTILCSIVSVPVALIDRSGRGYLRVARFWSRSFLWLYSITVETTGLENIQTGRPTVYIANHASYADVPIVLAAIPDNVRLMFRDTLTKIPIWGWALKASPFLIVSRSNAAKAKVSLTHATSVIRSGAAVLLFPEGTRTHDGAMHAFKRGAFKIALESDAVVIPIAIIGTFDLLPRSRKLPKTNCKIRLRIGSPITLPHDASITRQNELELMNQAEEATRQLLAKQIVPN